MDQVQLQTIELLKAAKPLFDNGDGYWIAAVGALGAIGGALAAYVPNRLMAQHQRKELRKSTAFQLYSEIRATLEVARHRRYLDSLKEIVDAFERDEASAWSFKVQVPDERFIIFKANLGNLGLLPPALQAQIVLLYQLLEAVVQDIRPGGILNSAPAGRAAFAEALRLSEKAMGLAEQILADIEKIYPDVASSATKPTAALVAV